MILLLEEDTIEANSYIEESAETKEKKYFIEGICIQSNVKNKNGRIYPKALVEREVARYITEKIERSQAVGELNHPKTDPSINYERVSHKYLSLTESGDNWIGKAQVTHKTPMGGIVAGLMECGVTMGTSTRAKGSTKLFEGAHVVQNDFRLITAGDIVADPSAPDAYLTNIMENKEWVYANGALFEKEAQIKNNINNLAKQKKLDKKSVNDLFRLILKQIN